MNTSQPCLQQTGHIRWIDNMRALTMLMVIYGHIVARPNAFFFLTSPMKMPGFFAISGYLFHCTDRSFGALTWNKLKKLAVPYVFLCGLSIVWNLLILWPSAGMSGFLQMLSSVACGTMLWYLPCLLVCEFAFYALVKLCKNRLPLICAGSVLLLAIGLLIPHEGIVLPWHINALPIVMFFFFLGYAYRQLEQRLTRWEGWWTLAVLSVVYLALCFAQSRVSGYSIDVNRSVYPDVWISIPSVVVGLAWLCQLTKLIPMPKWVTWIGQNTLVYYGTHYLTAQTLTLVLRRLGVPEATFFRGYYLLVQFVVSLVAVAGLALLINRFCPFLVGKKKKRAASQTS